ncbi:FUSC family protein [Imhoffiella purpurea]|nr:FUSC family protein [Imhoffiella purpurea]
MPKISASSLQFAFNTFLAAILALYLAMSIDLPRPYWAMMTVYIVSHPLAAAVRSKAIYRFLGTLLGAVGAVLLIPALVQAPVLLSLAMSLWVGICLTISVMDRSPRAYVLMLAGYTIALIGFPAVTEPTGIFDVAVNRVQEILLGIVCATLVHSLLFPRPVGETLRARIGGWLGEADAWALDLLRQGAGSPVEDSAVERDRVRLAGAASDIQLMAVHLPFDTSNLRETTAVVSLLRDRLLILIPVLSSLSDRIAAMRRVDPELDPEIRSLLGELADWVESGAGLAAARPLLARLESMAEATDAHDWHRATRLALIVRLGDLVKALGEGHALLAHLHAPDGPLPRPLGEQVAVAVDRPLHRDPELALLSGAAAFISIMLVCLVWIGSGWEDGKWSAMTAAITCSLFAAMDDPVPAIRAFGVYLLVSLLLAGLYLFVVMPAIGSFPMLALALAPMLLGIGVMIPDPRFAFPALSTILNVVNMLVIQDHSTADFGRFLNIGLSQFFGVFAAVFVTRSLRSMSAEVSARRLLRQTWRHLARLASGREEGTAMDFASRMLDRLGLLAPKLASAGNTDLKGVDILRELRVGMDVAALRGLRLPESAARDLDHLLDAVGERYRRLWLDGRAADEGSLLDRFDRLLERSAHGTSGGLGTRGVSALVGLRRNLFPDACNAPLVHAGGAS